MGSAYFSSNVTKYITNYVKEKNLKNKHDINGDAALLKLLNLKKEQFNLRFQRATGQLENTSRVRVVRREIARVKTIAAQKRAPSQG